MCADSSKKHHHEITVFYIGMLSSHWKNYSKAYQALHRVIQYTMEVKIVSMTLKSNSD